MASSQSYQDYLIISRSGYNQADKGWLREVSIFWGYIGGELHYHSLKLTGSFDSKAQAIQRGFELARLWIDKKL